MRLKPSLKNSVKPAALNLLIVAFLFSGCTSSTAPTFLKENLPEAIQNICKNEYKLEVKAKLMGQTLWVYLPLEDIFIKADKPERYLEKFSIEHNQDEFTQGTLKLEYLIKTVPEQEKYQEIKYDKAALEKMNAVWKVLRRVVFSLDRSKKDEVKFFCIVTADIKNGIKIQEIFYYLDLKKVSYEFISMTEYQHRNIQDMEISPQIIGDKDGLTINYREIGLEEFIANQIKHRIKLKFQRPEVDKNVDIDKEILKIITYTIKTYDFKDFKDVELNNLFTQNKVILSRAAVWARPME